MATKIARNPKTKTKTVWMLTSTNMTSVGLAMGHAHTTENYRIPFFTLDRAKAHAEKEYRKHTKENIEWKRDGALRWTSGDLSFVMYNIRREEIR